jgi:zinc/manganese transport system ATP-binding protein
MTEILKIKDATLEVDGRTLWSGLDLAVQPGEFIAVIGSNGSGKTSLLRTILGQMPLKTGKAFFDYAEADHGSPRIGYIPQQRNTDEAGAVLVKDLVRFGLNAHRAGIFVPRASDRKKIEAALAATGVAEYANQPFGSLSGGEQQRVRVAQAVVGDPLLLLCDEPLSALDLQQQKAVSELIHQQAKAHGAAVLFVTHDVNPVLDMVDRVLYLANGKFKIGSPDEVFRSEVLSELYETQVDVVRNQGRIVVVGTQTHDHHPDEVWS